jgi:hypothetical protein
MESRRMIQGNTGGNTMIWIGIILAVTFWLLESTMHFLVFDEAHFQPIPQDIHELWMRLVICFLFIGFGIYASLVMTKLKRVEQTQKTLQKRLEGALTKVLSGFLPICAQCKKIRDDRGNWIQIETYVRDHTEAAFSHTVCSECAKELYPNIDLTQ